MNLIEQCVRACVTKSVGPVANSERRTAVPLWCSRKQQHGERSRVDTAVSWFYNPHLQLVVIVHVLYCTLWFTKSSQLLKSVKRKVTSMKYWTTGIDEWKIPWWETPLFFEEGDSLPWHRLKTQHTTSPKLFKHSSQDELGAATMISIRVVCWVSCEKWKLRLYSLALGESIRPVTSCGESKWIFQNRTPPKTKTQLSTKIGVKKTEWGDNHI